MNYVYQMITTAASDGLGFAKILVGLDFDIFFYSSWVRVSSQKVSGWVLGTGYITIKPLLNGILALWFHIFQQILVLINYLSEVFSFDLVLNHLF